ncbi:MAG: helix-turn-helix domain-containing protein, partial [Spirochaetia bacterium]|nr:helix-turn-helix domain-containing protein [Spirochaetia bacterium]
MKKENYIVVQYWMVSEYKLSGNELLVFALIHGFTQDGETLFTGSLGYIAEFLNITKRTVMNILNELVAKEYIQKQEVFTNGVKFCKYKSFITSENISLPPGENISPNSIASNSLEIYIPVLEKWNSLNIIIHEKKVVKAKWQKKHTDAV